MSHLVIDHPDPDPDPGVDGVSWVSVSCNDRVRPEEFSLVLRVPAEALQRPSALVWVFYGKQISLMILCPAAARSRRLKPDSHRL